ncbi:hypothetical protein HMPREF9946_04911 [Acetobacteraceae bacterium AT-5844]|nr:hypothetical protein HMPREF9946_04911 [Acetobacteraceae bacterium AT-5844]
MEALPNSNAMARETFPETSKLRATAGRCSMPETRLWRGRQR